MSDPQRPLRDFVWADKQPKGPEPQNTQLNERQRRTLEELRRRVGGQRSASAWEPPPEADMTFSVEESEQIDRDAPRRVAEANSPLNVAENVARTVARTGGVYLESRWNSVVNGVARRLRDAGIDENPIKDAFQRIQSSVPVEDRKRFANAVLLAMYGMPGDRSGLDAFNRLEGVPALGALIRTYRRSSE